jgi:hypothetical protein
MVEEVLAYIKRRTAEQEEGTTARMTKAGAEAAEAQYTGGSPGRTTRRPMN